MRRAVLLMATALLASACELQEVTVAEPEPFIVVEAYLIAGSKSQEIAIHASAGAAYLLEEVESVRLSSGGDTIQFGRVNGTACLANNVLVRPVDFPGGLTCYAYPELEDDTAGVPAFVQAGGFYRLDVTLADGRALAGATRLPGQVSIGAGIGPGVPCYLAPWTQLDVTWRSTAGTAAYIADLRAFGVGEALEREGIEAEVPDPVILRGLAIGDQDTTIVLPSEFGLFDRFSLDANLLIALQQGMPEGISFDVTLAAVDQNYVNWVRGGDFNPSGLIRTPSMFGSAGTGVMASMTLDAFLGTTDDDSADLPTCAPPTS